MSSCGAPAVDGDALMTKRPKLARPRLCIKCKTNAGGIAVRNAIYCKACFFPITTMKFRRSLEPHINPAPDGPRKKALKPAGNLMLSFSGGLSSTVLLDLVERSYFTAQYVPLAADGTAKGGRDHPRNEPIWKRSSLCYVEVCAAFPGMRDRMDDVKAEFSRHPDFEPILLRLEDAFNHEWWTLTFGSESWDHASVDLSNEDLRVKLQTGSSEATPKLRLQQYLSSLPTSTAVVSAVQTLIRVLLLYTAKSRGCSHLLLGTSLTSLSISLISSISQGAGFAVHEEVQEEWQPPDSLSSVIKDGFALYTGPIRLLRPLQDLTVKECATWAWWSDLRIVGRDKWPIAKQGIGSLTKSFIIGLERNYPATVSTIAKTCVKLASRNDKHVQCVLCERPLQETAQAWKARISIRALGEEGTTSTGSIYDNKAHLASRLCYACHTTLTSQSSRAATKSSSLPSQKTEVPLPFWTAAHLRERPPSDKDHGLSSTGESDGTGTTGAADETWKTTKLSRGDMLAKVGEFILEE